MYGWVVWVVVVVLYIKEGSMSLYEMLDQKSKDNLNRVSQAVDKKHAEEFVKNNTLVEVGA